MQFEKVKKEIINSKKKRFRWIEVVLLLSVVVTSVHVVVLTLCHI